MNPKAGVMHVQYSGSGKKASLLPGIRLTGILMSNQLSFSFSFSREYKKSSRAMLCRFTAVQSGVKVATWAFLGSQKTTAS